MKKEVDPILLEVIKNGFDSIADEIALIMLRTAYSAIVRDAMDYSTAICDSRGLTLAQGLTTPLHLGSFYDAMQHVMRQYEGRVEPGDVFIGNDPYVASGQHLPDIYIILPIFIDDVLEGWSTTVAHHVDVGGIVPGSNALGATDIFQEGLRLPFLKLYDKGTLNQAIWDIMEINVRVPELMLGDLRAQSVACHVGAREYERRCSGATAPRSCAFTSTNCMTMPRPWPAASSPILRTERTRSPTTSTAWARIPRPSSFTSP